MPRSFICLIMSRTAIRKCPCMTGARLVDNKIEPGEEDLRLLNRELNRISASLAGGKKPEVSVTYFIGDPFKPGGRYETVCGPVRKVDTAEQKIILDRKITAGGAYMEIRIADILDIHLETTE